MAKYQTDSLVTLHIEARQEEYLKPHALGNHWVYASVEEDKMIADVVIAIFGLDEKKDLHRALVGVHGMSDDEYIAKGISYIKDGDQTLNKQFDRNCELFELIVKESSADLKPNNKLLANLFLTLPITDKEGKKLHKMIDKAAATMQVFHRLTVQGMEANDICTLHLGTNTLIHAEGREKTLLINFFDGSLNVNNINEEDEKFVHKIIEVSGYLLQNPGLIDDLHKATKLPLAKVMSKIIAANEILEGHQPGGNVEAAKAERTSVEPVRGV